MARQGVIDTHYFGVVKVLCDDAYNGGTMANLYTDGAVNNIAAFHNAITSADFSNPTVAPSVRSNLTTILGRTAAYSPRRGHLGRNDQGQREMGGRP